MRLLLLAVVLLAIPASAQAPDTLDWHRYYPLAVGNVWEYQDAEVWNDQFRHTLIADTLVSGRTYFVRRTDSASAVSGPAGPDTLRSTRVDYVGYDEAGGGVVAFASLDAPDAFQPCSFDGFERELTLGFGARRACVPSPGPLFPDSVRVEGDYDTFWHPPGSATAVPVAAIKRFLVGVISSTFVADIGPVRTGNLWGPELRYARIGGADYGMPGFAVGEEPGGPLTPTDAAAAVPTDYRIALANLTMEPVVLDSLVMRFAEAWGYSTWSVMTDGPPGVFCYFAPFEPDWERCALGVTLAPGTVVRLDVGYDPCAICRGGAPDTLLVYSGGVVEPDTVTFDDSGYVGTDEGPTAGALALSVAPNPSRGASTVTLTGAVPLASARVVLLDALGRRVAVLHDGALPADARLALPPGLPPGVYSVSADADGHAATARVTIAR